MVSAVLTVPVPTELVIFDCDGVLVDSERLCVQVESRLITELGWSLSVAEVVERFVGRSDSYMLAEIEAALGRTVPEWKDRYEPLGLTGLYDRFAGRIFSATEVPNGKPAPDLFLHAAEQLAADPANCVVVEDSPSGLQAARAAGMRCIAYASGLVPVDRLVGPDTTVIRDMATLPAHL
jgi:beta-phosphoglucomutase-like phosphatase (HAD superfamily)